MVVAGGTDVYVGTRQGIYAPERRYQCYRVAKSH